VHPEFRESFLESEQWRDLPETARAALEGSMPYLMRSGGDWIIEGTPAQIAQALASETGHSKDEMVEALRELVDGGLAVRKSVGVGSEVCFVVKSSVLQ